MTQLRTHKTLLALALATLGFNAQAAGLIRVPLGGTAALATHGLVVAPDGATVPYTTPPTAPAGASTHLVGHLRRTGYTDVTLTINPTLGPCTQTPGVPILRWDGTATATGYQGESFDTVENLRHPVTKTYADTPVANLFKQTAEATLGSQEFFEANVDFCVPATQAELDQAYQSLNNTPVAWDASWGFVDSVSSPDVRSPTSVVIRHLTIPLPTTLTPSVTLVSPMFWVYNANYEPSRTLIYLMNSATNIDIFPATQGGTVVVPFRDASGTLTTTDITYAY